MRKLTSNFANPLVLWHEQGTGGRGEVLAHVFNPSGHVVPTLDTQQMEQVEAFLGQQMVCSPHSKL